MEKSEWYTNRTWNGAIDAKFEKYLKHTRDISNKAEFMQIQGALLLDNNQQQVQNVGVALLTRVIEDYKTAYTSVILSQEKLGDYYLHLHEYKQAEHFYRIVIQYCKQQNSRSGTSTLADLKLAEAILKSNEETKLEEAFQLVTTYPVTILKLMDTKFYYSEIAAQICDALHKDVEARQFASAALKLPKLIKPAFKAKAPVPIKVGERKLRSLQEIVAV